jgi:hypothetical protein
MSGGAVRPIAGVGEVDALGEGEPPAVPVAVGEPSDGEGGAVAVAAGVVGGTVEVVGVVAAGVGD